MLHNNWKKRSSAWPFAAQIEGKRVLNTSRAFYRFYDLFTFFLDKKSNKKVKAIRCGTFFKAQVFLSRIAVLENHFVGQIFRSETPLRDMGRFLEALNFSLEAFCCLMHYQVKNEALEQVFSLR